MAGKSDLRNQYAGMAMQAMISRLTSSEIIYEYELHDIVKRSVSVADMLIEELAKKNEGVD